MHEIGSATPSCLRRLSRADLPSDTTALARFLIGKYIVRFLDGIMLAGRIVETEAYGVDDAASHAYRGMTARNRSMFLAPGHAYVYFIYGTSYMLNVSSEPAGIGAGVLLRALEPARGIDRMTALRGGVRLSDIARGPGRLTASMRIDRSLDGQDLCADGPLWLAQNPDPDPPIAVSVRIGISREAHRPLRFYVPGSPFVSGPSRLRS